MRPRTLLVVVLILFCLRMSGRAPAPAPPSEPALLSLLVRLQL